MGVCGSKSVDSASDSSDSDSEEPSQKPSHHGVTVARSEVCVQGVCTARGIRSLVMSRISCKALFW